jgi:hypothetical protein
MNSFKSVKFQLNLQSGVTRAKELENTKGEGLPCWSGIKYNPKVIQKKKVLNYIIYLKR